VDDEPSVLDMFDSMLDYLGFEVLVAKEGREAVELFRQNPEKIRCVITDLTMAQMSGEETFQELRRVKSDIPVILTSGYGEKEMVERFGGKGFAGFLVKPFNLATLRLLLKTSLN
jgi:two-component system, cell cycle sensor histidine kinase and response regulator CckA